jgi:hypothetical protein
LAAIHPDDTIARYGGEEFAVLLADADAATAVAVAEELRYAIRQMGAPVPVTASIGVASFPQHADDPDALIAVADAASTPPSGRDATAPPVPAYRSPRVVQATVAKVEAGATDGLRVLRRSRRHRLVLLCTSAVLAAALVYVCPRWPPRSPARPPTPTTRCQRGRSA